MTGTPGYGGYAYGELPLPDGEKIFLYVGGAAGTPSANVGGAGGWNGGATGGGDYDNDAGGGGGGATDIRLIAGNLYSRIMVAGGGGGCGWGVTGGGGGGVKREFGECWWRKPDVWSFFGKRWCRRLRR
ncbi:hypothetical protein DXA95_17315 [Odoribacter sp. OF09-27XD]|nr:hypothetical protein DXA95_17315 [Odoribacter sp. OF09-27XD]